MIDIMAEYVRVSFFLSYCGQKKNKGAALITKIKKHLGENNVIDIMSPNPNGGILAPKGALSMHANDGGNTRFLVCGGDGAWGETFS